MPRKAGFVFSDKQKADIKALFILHVSNGDTVARVCRMQKVNIDRNTFYNWMKDDPDFMHAMEQAREKGMDAIAEQTLDIADYSANDWMETEKGLILDKEAVLRSKLRVETRLKLLACWHPKRYGQQSAGKEYNTNALPATVPVQIVPPDPVDE